VLNQLKVHVDNIDSLPPSGESLPDEIRRRVENADFVCGVLLQTPTASARTFGENVLFELGVAVGCESPIFIVAESMNLIPHSLASYPYVLGALHDQTVLHFHLNAFLKGLSLPLRRSDTVKGASSPLYWKELPVPSERMGVEQSVSKRAKADIIHKADIIREYLSRVTSEVELTRAVAQAFELSGARVTSEASIEGHERPDVVAWLPNPTTDLGPALLVEIKRTATEPKTIERALNQVQRYMSAAGIRTGLLLAPDAADEIEVRIVPAGYLFITSMNTLLTLVSRGRLEKGLTEARNRYVHSAM
jgi:hypothetical protein